VLNDQAAFESSMAVCGKSAREQSSLATSDRVTGHVNDSVPFSTEETRRSAEHAVVETHTLSCERMSKAGHTEPWRRCGNGVAGGIKGAPSVSDNDQIAIA
jgi:hypothetical protein